MKTIVNMNMSERINFDREVVNYINDNRTYILEPLGREPSPEEMAQAAIDHYTHTVDAYDEHDQKLSEEQKDRFFEVATRLFTTGMVEHAGIFNGTCFHDRLLDKFIVLKERYPDVPLAYVDRFRITERENFEKVNYCDCYDNFGNPIGCYGTCYSLDNSDSEAIADCMKAIFEHFGATNTNPDYYDLEFYTREFTDDDDPLHRVDRKAITAFIENWKNKHEDHSKVTAWNYWDGSNWQSCIIEDDEGVEYPMVEADREESLSVLVELPETPHIEGTGKTIHTENFFFSYSRWSNDPWICTAETKIKF